MPTTTYMNEKKKASPTPHAGSTGAAALSTGNYFIGVDWDKKVQVCCVGVFARVYLDF